MKQLTASEARDLTELSTLPEIYEEISLSAQKGHYYTEVGDLNEKEFNQLIKDGFRIYVNHGTEEYTKWHRDLLYDYDCVRIDWEV